ncbi:MAG: DNA alkylation repair protein [Candidatus Aenigmarchaeota archaeon]|nr:DNA alkylation repair protein [Candidatus Aenigmarchaeota archaeon]
MEPQEVLRRLKHISHPEVLASMASFGIRAEKAYGVTVPLIRKMAKELGKNHMLALRLWDTGVHEARILATMMAEPEKMTERQMERWVSEITSWDVGDHFCGNLMVKTPLAYDKAFDWSSRKDEFVKRAGFALMAYLAVHDKKADDKKLEAFFAPIRKQSGDDRNFVKKAVNWALRQIGKRNAHLNKLAVQVAHDIQLVDTPTTSWIASNALRELESDAVKKRLS